MKSKKHFVGLLVASSIALAACSNQQVVTDANQNTSVEVSSQTLQSIFSEGILSHRKAGEIATNSFESKIRNQVRSDMNINFDYLANASKDELLADLENADSRLSMFKHATYRGSALEQLWALLPALPSIEKRKALQIALLERFDEQPKLANDRMAELMDLQINKLFSSFMISLDALTPETEKFEALLVQELKSEGLNISARRPSLILEYFIDSYSDQGEVELVADFEFKDRSAQAFHSLSSTTTYASSDGQQAQKDAFSLLANDITEQLIEKATHRINDVNSVK